MILFMKKVFALVKARRKVLYFILLKLLILCLLVPVSCSKNKENAGGGGGNFDIKAASNVAEAYMKSVEKGNMENAKKYYSKKLQEGSEDKENKDFIITGFNITEATKVGDSGMFKIRVARSSTKESYAALDEYIVKVIKEGFDYKIDDTKNNPLKEAFLVYGKIRLKSKNNVDTSLLFDLDSVPNFAFSKDDKTNTDKLPVPKSKFDMMAFSYDGNKIILTTSDTGFFVGYVKIDESKEVQGSDDSSGKKSNGDSSGQGTTAKEKPVGKELMVLDVIKDSKIDFITFSQDEKYIAMEYNKASTGKILRIYKSNNGDLIKYDFEKNFPAAKVNIDYSYFDKDTLYFEVSPKTQGDNSLKDYVGKWELDLKELKAKKV
ncbi:MAG: hypothetical protein ACM3X7_08580 [Solirubrobacterales bacterium]